MNNRIPEKGPHRSVHTIYKKRKRYPAAKTLSTHSKRVHVQDKSLRGRCRAVTGSKNPSRLNIVGNPIAQLKMAECYEEGLYGVPKDLELARECYGDAAQQGSVKARMKLRALGKKKDPQQAAWLMKLRTFCEKKDAPQVAWDKAKAHALYKKAIRHLCEAESICREKNTLQAWYTTKARALYEESIKHIQLAKKALCRVFEYCRDAAQQGNADAKLHLGKCYEVGLGVKRNYKLAIDCYVEAFWLGRVEGVYDMGRCYDKDSEEIQP